MVDRDVTKKGQFWAKKWNWFDDYTHFLATETGFFLRDSTSGSISFCPCNDPSGFLTKAIQINEMRDKENG